MLLDIFSTDSLSVVNAEATVSTLDKLLDYLFDVSVALGTKIVASIIVFIVCLLYTSMRALSSRILFCLLTSLNIIV